MGLKYKQQPTGAIYGVLQDVYYLAQQFGPEFTFCFDSSKSQRKLLNADYKASREVNCDKRSIMSQLELLRTEILPQMGLINCFRQVGREGDDLIAAIVSSQSHNDPIVVSGDQDLYQLLDFCSIYEPAKRSLYTKKAFIVEYGTMPSDWSRVKAIAGCTSDDVQGVPRVGTKTAIKYLNNELKETTIAYKNIQEHSELIASNMALVSLPFPGTIVYKPKPCSFNKDAFEAVCRQYGLASFLSNIDTWNCYLSSE